MFLNEVPDAPAPTKSQAEKKPEKGRHRASIACISCRDRRIRCVVPPGDSECTQCRRSKTECIIKNDDERRRPISKAYMSCLADRVAMLEGMLSETGKHVPPANYPPKTRAEAPVPKQAQDADQNQNQSHPQSNQQSTTPRSMHDGSTDGENGYNNCQENNDLSNNLLEFSHPAPRIVPAKKEGLVHMLLSTRGHLSFDQLSGRLRFFGPTSNCHIYADNNGPVEQRELPEQVRRTERIIRSLSLETHDYLMNLFWEHYNTVLHIVHKESFNTDMQSSQNKFYSGFLHITILAMGYRFANLSREDMKMITLGNRECTLHREAKYMIDSELERPGGMPSVQAFLILGDLEVSVGRDGVGWMYAGMANRLCFDLGLHLDCQNDGLPEREVHVRQMTLFACVVYDKYWALFLGRPTGIKSSDLEMYRLSAQFSCLSACKPAGVQKCLETQIYEELLCLMELAGKIAEIRNPGEQSHQDIDKANEAYLYVMNLDRQLQTWYRRLPDNLVWKPANTSTAPFSYFLLHQQYHCSLILLHRPWARYEDPTPPSSDDGEEDDIHTDNNHSYMSRQICTRQAIRVSRIFWHHRQRFDTRRIFCTGMQHAGTAATALVAALASIKDTSARKSNMQYLECLAGALQDMGSTYQPAVSMSSVLQAVMIELENCNEKTPPPDFAGRWRGGESVAIPARRDSNSMTIDNDDMRTLKKRQLSRASSTRPSITTPLQSSMALSTSGMTPQLFQPDDRRDGYVMSTPRSEASAWPKLTSDLNALDYPMQFSIPTPGMSWLGQDMDSGFEEGTHKFNESLLCGDGLTESLGAEPAVPPNEDRDKQELDFFQF
ncbi:fungal-specific transcription factor domain-containing protein [Calycina marina]|uniref:Fungal-specific transcription factor domain-containing protein n=1 Tax=Calycina marina TaxID=1763456 RepID=A0A9P7Z3U6_9HELO|nr:fungal-specific transcription factor domain-containing protein [Calycina marina]